MSVQIELLPDPVRHGLATSGGVKCEQSAVITVDQDVFDQIWTPSTLELLARSYWRFIRRRSLGAIRVVYRPDSQTVVLCNRRIPLLRFHSPTFHTQADAAHVEWRIDRGLLVARTGRGHGYLRIEVKDQGAIAGPSPRRRLLVTSEVSNFYPWIRGTGRFARMGTWIYSQTQLRSHIWVTKGFLRSLQNLPEDVLKRGEDPETEPADS